MQTFFCKLHPPRPTFPSDITPEESKLMAEHAAYWREWMAKGNIVAFGPVMDGSAAYGIGIVQFDDEAGVRSFADNDPTIKARVGFRMEVQPMPHDVITPFSGP